MKHSFLMKLLFIAAAIVVIIFIFVNSSKDAAESKKQSTAVQDIIEKVIETVPGEHPALTQKTIRKIAHVVEYFLLGVCLSAILFTFTEKPVKYLPYPLLAGLLIAVIDETIQISYDGRGPAIIDVWIDFAAIFAACALSTSAILLYKRSKKAKRDAI